MSDIKGSIAVAELIVRDMEISLSEATSNLYNLRKDIQNHIYESVEKAKGFLYDQFDNEAENDCEGSGNCGCDEYSQDFIVDGKKYTAIGKFEYDRHDKTYYYIDGCEFSYKEKA
jgi:hypothetical protein